MSLHRLAIYGLTALAMLAAPFWACAQGVITTVAGNGRVFHGNGSPATSAALGEIWGVALDSAGNLYASDGANNLVVKISSNGILTVVAGNNIAGFSGDGGPATAASLNSPRGVAVDAAGILYIADESNNRVRRVTLDGTITTVAGNGQHGFAGDGGSASSASLADPYGVTVDRAGNLYIADFSNARIRKVGPDGIISTVAGNGNFGFSGDGVSATNTSLHGPQGVAVDGAGNIYIDDVNSSRIRKVGENGIITTVAGNGLYGFSGDGGAATSASLNSPWGLAVDSFGNLYIADWNNLRVRKVRPDGIIITVAGNGFCCFSGDGGPATSASLNYTSSVAVDVNGNLYIADTYNARIRRVSPDGTITTVAGLGLLNISSDGGPASTAPLSRPSGLVADAAGNVYVGDESNHRIRKIGSMGTITTVAGNGVATFSGDSSLATAASLNSPMGVAVDGAGNLYIADKRNNRVRKVNSAGIISTIAGTGVEGFSGDGGPAINSQLNGPRGVAVDAVGNLYIADDSNNRVRKVTPDGVITTFAGSGPVGVRHGGFAGDGGLASSALLESPYGVAVDQAGNVYIADTGNARIRKVTPGGIISTVAGGRSASPGDGGPATSAFLQGPYSVAVDTPGNLYIADKDNSRIRKVSPAGLITTVAGNGNTGFSGDGGPATSAALNSPEGVWVDTAGDIFIADNGNDRIRKVLATPPSFSVAPATLSFTAPAGSGVIGPKQIMVSSPITGLLWNAQESTQSGGDWIALSPTTGSAPGTISVLVNAPAGLDPGTYQGTVTVTAPNANPSAQTVTVTFNVTPPIPAQLGVAPNTFSFSFKSGSPASNAPVSVSNRGSGSLNFTTSASTKSGGGWLSVAPASGTATETATATLTVTANPANLNPGTYTGQVSAVSSATGESVDVPVTMTISAVQQTILLSQTGVTFTAVANGGTVPPQTFGILNTGQGVMNWSVSASTLSGGSNWLSVTPASGASDASSLQVPLVQVAINPAELAPGAYYGQVQISAGGADNSPQIVSVVLNVLAAGSNPGPVIQPKGLIFTGVAGGTSPGSQNVSVTNLTSNPASFASGRLTFDGGNWFVNLPTNDTVASGQPSRIVVQPDLTGLNAAIRRGVLTLLFADGAVQQVNLLFVLIPRAGVQPQEFRPAESGCTPTTLLPIFTSLATNFSVPTGWPNPVEVRVVDDCGNPMVTGSVVASFSNGDPPLILARLGEGRWSGAWQARNSTTAQVTVTITAQIPEEKIRGTVQVTGGLGAGQNSPIVGPGAVVSAAAFVPQIPVAPGSLVSIFGTKLSDSRGAAPALPLDTQLAGSRTSIGGQPMPLLYASDGQINAMVPYGIAVNTQSQIVVQRGFTASVPEPVTVAAAQPAVFTKDQSGKGQGLIFVGGTLADGSSPAKAGDTVVVYCSGLGEVSPPVAAGAAAPSSPLSTTVNPVSVMIGGGQAQVPFAGLAPGFAGLYQVNAIVPGGIGPDNEISVTLTVAGQTSPPVTMAVR